jgi:hypothetical protein
VLDHDGEQVVDRMSCVRHGVWFPIFSQSVLDFAWATFAP